LAYISYNTYPGWKYREVIRDAMMFRSANIKNAQERLSYGLGMIDFLQEHSPVGSLNKSNIDATQSLLKNAQDYYLLHDYFELCNLPCYFHEFIERSKRNKLIYLAESQPSTMFVSNFPSNISEPLLRECGGNQVVLEQHLDFLNERTFRQTILVPENRASEINYQIDNPRLQQLHFAGTFTPIESSNRLIGLDESLTFQTINGAVKIEHPLAILAAQILDEHYPSTLEIHTLIQIVNQKSQHTDKPQKLIECLPIIFQFIQSMIIKGMIRYRCSPITLATEIAEYPLKDAHTYQTHTNKGLITNTWHDPIQLNVIEQSILPLLDGQHDYASLRNHLHQEAANHRITFSKQDLPITNPEELEASINDHLQTNLISLKRKGLLAR
ncbi:MAG: methyltransferase regulatory domain-containing protein, partial [Gammaproteobacteria bacterium]|nr:methyltransferase regulatory domain-containing protein [Gammaproteobacteria bacterium]